jgi:hypothetical protein
MKRIKILFEFQQQNYNNIRYKLEQQKDIECYDKVLIYPNNPAPVYTHLLKCKQRLKVFTSTKRKLRRNISNRMIFSPFCTW